MNDLHRIWPYNPQLMFCPHDQKLHRFGCRHIVENPDLVPRSLRTFYAENNEEYSRALALHSKE